MYRITARPSGLSRWAEENNHGERHPNACLSDTQISEIRNLLEAGVIQRVIAEQYGVTRQHISAIKTNRRRGGIS